MLTEFMKKEVESIMGNSKWEYPLNSAMACSWLAANYKAENIKVFKAPEESSLSDYYVIATLETAMQSQSLAEDMQRAMRSNQITTLSIEGQKDGEWVLIDLGDAIIHLFTMTSRDVYNLDELWMKYQRVEIPEDFYFASSVSQTKTDELDDYIS